MSLDPDTIAQQRDLLTAHRRTLDALLQQAAQFSAGHIPAHIANGIAEARANISRIKAILSENGTPVEDEPNDEAPPATSLAVTEAERKIAEQRELDAILVTYINEMKELLDKNLRKSRHDAPVRGIARTRTVMALRRLDGEHNRNLIQFLQDTRLLGGDEPFWARSHLVPIPVVAGFVIDLLNISPPPVEVLSYTNLEGVNLAGADLRVAALRSANLQAANLKGTNLQAAKLYGANLQAANLQAANLYWAELGGAKLQGANLQAANLEHAYLRGANLEEADLRETDLRETDLREADLRAANLQGANLRGANLQDANLKGTTMPDGTKHE